PPLRRHPQLPLSDVAYTLQVGRRRLPHRLAVVCTDLAQACAALAGDRHRPRRAQATSPGLAMMFPGQGTDLLNAGRQLFERQPLFRQLLQEASQITGAAADLDLLQVLYPDPADASKQAQARQQLQRTEVAQVALFAVEFAVAQLWRSWGVEPQWLLSHCMDVSFAATLAGVFALYE